jgi:deazaflavin-dependent oxidoreductase (nitroreductase family)
MTSTDPRVLERRARDEAVIAEMRATNGLGVPGSMPIVILHTIGAVTGKVHIKPVCVREDGADLIVAGTAGGQRKHPQWYPNLVAHPDITVEYHGETFEVTATTVPNSTDRDRLFEMMDAVIPGIYGYQDRCRETRQIPIVRLVRR